jgi:gamma-glutamylputrescine oxidase
MWAWQGEKRVDACDVVVVGAGLVGAAVAAGLSRAGFNTAVLEARSVASGATGRCAGMVLTGLAGHYSWAAAGYGRETAREVWALTVEGRERLIEKAEQLALPVKRTGSLALAVDAAEMQALEESAALMEEDGFDVQFYPQDPLGRGFHGALHYPGDATVDAAGLTQALLSTNDITVHEGTEVYGVEREGDGVRVWAHRRTVLCGAVVLAINGYAPLFDLYFTDKIAPVRSLTLATAPLDQVILEQPCWADDGYAYCYQLPDRRLFLGSSQRPRAASLKAQGRIGQENKPDDEPDDAVHDGLLRFAQRHFSDVAAEMHNADRWSGVMGFTPDGLPLVGRLPKLSQVYFAVGLGGRGLAWSFVIADRLVHSMLDSTSPGMALFGRGM